jgi:disulfide bond formation protein DsbB
MKHWLLIMIILVAILALTACGGGAPAPQAKPNNTPAQAAATPTQAPAGDPVAGEKLFTQTCSACHGPKGEGVTGLGKDMTKSEFIAGKSDAELLAFVKVGRDPSDPLNTTGVAMPPKGGNPALTDQNLQDIIAFIRTIHKK